jgi:glycerol kinase
MPRDLVLAIDQGTTNSKAILVDNDSTVIARGLEPVAISHPRPGWVEQDPEAIWQSVRAAVAKCVAGAEASRIAAIGISNQRESVLIWDGRSGEPLGPCITWQCRRTSEQCHAIVAAGHAETVVARTGLPVDPLFAATKIRWLLDHIPSGVRASDVRAGTVDSWLLWRMTGGKAHRCDVSNAARTQLFNIESVHWDPQLCDMFDVPIELLPEVANSNAHFGDVTCGDPFPQGVPIRAMIGDSHAALFGHGVTAPGEVKATYGTGTSVLTLLAHFLAPPPGLTTTIAWCIDGTPVYAFEGNIAVSASSIPWAAGWLGLNGSPEKLAALAESVPDTGGVYFVPALVGLGAPYWNADARGVICGMSFNTGVPELARAIMESIAYQVHDVFAVMQASAPERLRRLFADGGASRNDWLMQFQADVLAVPVVRREASDASALGAALMTRTSGGAQRKSVHTERTIEPTLPAADRDRLIAGWHAAVERALHGA